MEVHSPTYPRPIASVITYKTVSPGRGRTSGPRSPLSNAPVSGISRRRSPPLRKPVMSRSSLVSTIGAHRLMVLGIFWMLSPPLAKWSSSTIAYRSHSTPKSTCSNLRLTRMSSSAPATSLREGYSPTTRRLFGSIWIWPIWTKLHCCNPSSRCSTTGPFPLPGPRWFLTSTFLSD